MTNIKSADLAAANASSMITQLKETSQASSQILGNMRDFIYNSSNQLKGAGYDAVRAKLSVYVDAISKQAQICDNLSNNVIAANNVMLTFMDGYTYLDNSYIQDIENSIADVKSFLGWLTSYSKDNTKNGTDAEIAKWDGIRADLEKKLEKLKKLDSTDSSSFAMLDDVSEDMMNFAKAIYELKLPNYDGTIPDDQNSAEFRELISHVGMGGEPVFYYQKGWYDEDGKLHPWKSSWGKSIATSGCGPTSMAACLATMLGDKSITPSTIANMMNYEDNRGGVYVGKACSKYDLDCTSKIGLSKTSMNNFLTAGGKMIVAVNYGGHYIAVIGINNKKKPPTYIVCDPNNPKKREWTYNEIAATHTMVFHIAPKGRKVNECV